MTVAAPSPLCFSQKAKGKTASTEQDCVISMSLQGKKLCAHLKAEMFWWELKEKVSLLIFSCGSHLLLQGMW